MVTRIVIADDHTILYEGLKAIFSAHSDLETIGYAENGLRAVEIAKELQPDIVIMDIAMPELNGLSATLQLRQQVPETSVIILSMHMTSEHVYQALKAGAKGYLLKESAGRELVEAIRMVARGKRYLTSAISEIIIDDYIQMRDSTNTPSPIDRLSEREIEVLQLVVEGHTSIDIAERLALSPSTVDTYRSRVFTKLGIDNLPDLVRFALQNGITVY